MHESDRDRTDDSHWRTNCRRLMCGLRWASFIYAVPGMLFLVSLILWRLVPALLLIGGLIVVQLPILLAWRKFMTGLGSLTPPASGPDEDSLVRRQRMLSA